MMQASLEVENPPTIQSSGLGWNKGMRGPAVPPSDTLCGPVPAAFDPPRLPDNASRAIRPAPGYFFVVRDRRRRCSRSMSARVQGRSGCMGFPKTSLTHGSSCRRRNLTTGISSIGFFCIAFPLMGPLVRPAAHPSAP